MVQIRNPKPGLGLGLPTPALTHKAHPNPAHAAHITSLRYKHKQKKNQIKELSRFKPMPKNQDPHTYASFARMQCGCFKLLNSANASKKSQITRKHLYFPSTFPSVATNLTVFLSFSWRFSFQLSVAASININVMLLLSFSLHHIYHFSIWVRLIELACN